MESLLREVASGQGSLGVVADYLFHIYVQDLFYVQLTRAAPGKFLSLRPIPAKELLVSLNPSQKDPIDRDRIHRAEAHLRRQPQQKLLGGYEIRLEETEALGLGRLLRDFESDQSKLGFSWVHHEVVAGRKRFTLRLFPPRVQESWLLDQGIEYEYWMGEASPDHINQSAREDRRVVGLCLDREIEHGDSFLKVHPLAYLDHDTGHGVDLYALGARERDFRYRVFWPVLSQLSPKIRQWAMLDRIITDARAMPRCELLLETTGTYQKVSLAEKFDFYRKLRVGLEAVEPGSAEFLDEIGERSLENEIRRLDPLIEQACFRSNGLFYEKFLKKLLTSHGLDGSSHWEYSAWLKILIRHIGPEKFAEYFDGNEDADEVRRCLVGSSTALQ